MRRRLRKRWQKIHYGVYVVGILGVWHYWWQVKLDIMDPLIYTAVLVVLLGYRIWWRYKHTSARKQQGLKAVEPNPKGAFTRTETELSAIAVGNHRQLLP